MKQLLLVRHAKSDHVATGEKDIDRPLNRRGRGDVPVMAKRLAERLAEKGVDLPERVVASSASRTRETAELFAAHLGLSEDRIQLDPQIYIAGESRLLQICRALDDDWDVVMLVGHNPAITDLLNLLCDNVRVDHMPPCGIAHLQIPERTWAALNADVAELQSFDYPDRVSHV